MIINQYVNITSGVQVTVTEDKKGDRWESVRQLPFMENGHLTPLGRLADRMMAEQRTIVAVRESMLARFSV